MQYQFEALTGYMVTRYVSAARGRRSRKMIALPIFVVVDQVPGDKLSSFLSTAMASSRKELRAKGDTSDYHVVVLLARKQPSVAVEFMKEDMGVESEVQSLVGRLNKIFAKGKHPGLVYNTIAEALRGIARIARDHDFKLDRPAQRSAGRSEYATAYADALDSFGDFHLAAEEFDEASGSTQMIAVGSGILVIGGLVSFYYAAPMKRAARALRRGGGGASGGKSADANGSRMSSNRKSKGRNRQHGSKRRSAAKRVRGDGGGRKEEAAGERSRFAPRQSETAEEGFDDSLQSIPTSRKGDNDTVRAKKEIWLPWEKYTYWRLLLNCKADLCLLTSTLYRCYLTKV